MEIKIIMGAASLDDVKNLIIEVKFLGSNIPCIWISQFSNFLTFIYILSHSTGSLSLELIFNLFQDMPNISVIPIALDFFCPKLSCNLDSMGDQYL